MRRQDSGTTPPHGDDGIALVFAIAVVTVLLAASTSVAVSVVNNVTNVENGVLSATATQSTSAGFNAAVVTLQSDLQGGTALPCSLSGSLTQGQGSAPQSYSVALKYYNAVNLVSSPPTASGLIACVSGVVASSSGVAAMGMVDTGTAGTTHNSATQTVVALFSLASSAFAGGYGIYDDSGVQLTNSIGVSTNSGTFFVNGPVQCNSATINGPLYVYDPGDANATTVGNPANNALDMLNGCTITGALDVNGDTGVNTSSPKVHGNALVNGSVTFNNTGPQFLGNLTASGTVTPASTSYVSGTISQNATVGLPAVPAFPIVTWNSGAWTNAGWQVDNYTGTCGGWANSNQTPTGVYLELSNDVADNAPTVLYTSCALALPQNLVLQLSANFAIVDTATGGMNFTADTIESQTSQLHNLDLIVPSDPVSPATASVMSQATCSTNYEIQASNQEAFGTSTNPVDTTIYDPCTVAFNNGGSLTGQVVAGSLGSALTNELSYTAASSGAVPGTTNEPGGLTAIDQYVLSSTG